MDFFTTHDIDESLLMYSLLSFRRDKLDILAVFERESLIQSIQQGSVKIYQVESPVLVVYETLDWDSRFFGRTTIKIKYALAAEEINYLIVADVIKSFLNTLDEQTHVIVEVPSIDTRALKAFSSIGFLLVESRINYYRSLSDYNWPLRYKVRRAIFSDIENLRRVASEMANPFDRFHNDPAYNTADGDRFLATYAEESVKGFADIVMVPDEDGVLPDAFYAARYQKNIWDKIGFNASKIIVSAVDSKSRKGWFLKLNSEMNFHLIEQGAEYVYFQTATANKAVIHSNEKLGYKIGSVSHYFSMIVR